LRFQEGSQERQEEGGQEMSRGMTIADFVQQVFYAIYKVRLDTSLSADQAYHAGTDKFKEVLMEANFVQQELQQQMDWGWLRKRWNIGTAECLGDGKIQEFEIPKYAYKVASGFNDAVRLHVANMPQSFIEVPYTSPRSGTTNVVAMHDEYGRMNVPDNRLQAFVVGDHLTFTRPFGTGEAGLLIETDVIKLLPTLHICSDACSQPCVHAYEDLVFTEIADPYYMVARTAAKRAEGDPSATDRILPLTDDAMKILSAMRENDSGKTVPDTYTTSELGFVRVM
jgi:hypothetical protein